MGRISEEQAKAKGFFGANGSSAYKPMPPELWHVTTAADAIKSGGIKTRYEIGQDNSGKGLGGGPSDTISYTDDPKIAQVIYSAMKEAHSVARGEKTIQEMMDQAAKGYGANKPFLDDIMLAYASNHKPGSVPQEVQDMLDGVVVKRSVLKIDNDESRPMTDEEKSEARFGFFKKFLFFREHAGGPMDPLFFMTDVMGFAAVDPEQIKVVKVKSKPNAHGYQVSALGEWRTHTGDNVEVVDVYDDEVNQGLLKSLTLKQKQIVKKFFSWNKEYREEDHPRGDDGRWIDKLDVIAAIGDSVKLQELFDEVTDPEQRKLLQKWVDKYEAVVAVKSIDHTLSKRIDEMNEAELRESLTKLMAIEEMHRRGIKLVPGETIMRVSDQVNEMDTRCMPRSAMAK